MTSVEVLLLRLEQLVQALRARHVPCNVLCLTTA